MRLFTRLSAAEAEQAMRGTLRGDLLWFDSPALDEAGPGVWVAIDMPDVRLARFESHADPGRGHREFLIPSRVTNLLPAEPAQLPG